MNPSPYNSMVYEDVMMLRKLGIPTGVYWLDRPWAKGPFGYDDFTFDETRFPKPKEMIDWLRDKNGMELLLWVAPWIYGETRALAQGRGYIAPNSDKVIDFTNPDAVEWWQSEFKKVFDLGVAGFKLDRCEEVIPSREEDVYFDGRNGRELHNLYPMLYAKAVQGACQKHRGDDCLVMPRAGFTGSQQYAVFWGGDTHPSWRGLRSAVISAQRSGLMGFPVWGSDTGGYGVSESQDLFSRWMQVSSLHPIMEVGGSGSHEPWNAGYEPKYDQTGIDNYRLFAKLHTELIPYNYSAMYEAHATGHPIVRPLVYEWPGDPRVRDMWDEWLFGNWVLAAPVLSEGARAREVYLPEGVWYDFWDMRSEYQGGRNYLVRAPISRMPIFIRGGAIIPLRIMDAETGWGEEFIKDAFAIAFFPAGGESRFLLYDNGKEMPVSMKETDKQIVIDTSAVSEQALLRVRTAKPRAITVNGKELQKFKDEKEFASAASGYIWDSPARKVWIRVPASGMVVIEK
jgi:alpha-glucosidase (family GH31 glycosyl hydrolase)